MHHNNPEQEKQLEILKELIKSNPKPQELKRALAVKLALEGYSYRAIQKILEVSIGFISKWKNAFEFGGIEGLKSRYQGSQSFLNRSEKEEVIDWLIQQEAWDISELETHLIERYDVVFKSRQSYYELLNQARITWQKGEQVNPRYNPEQNQELTPEEWSVTCCLFAPYSPKENPVEAIWLQLKTLLRRFYRLGKNFTTVKRLFQLFVSYQLFNLPNLKNYDAFSQFA